MERRIKTPDDWAAFLAWVADMPLPFTVSAVRSKDRTIAQNATIHLWFSQISAHRKDVSPADVKAECNLAYGVPIKRRDNPEWASAFGYLFDQLSYAAKLKALRVLDIPVTRSMNVKQLAEYMDQMQRDYLAQGVPLVDPEGKE